MINESANTEATMGRVEYEWWDQTHGARGAWVMYVCVTILGTNVGVDRDKSYVTQLRVSGGDNIDESTGPGCRRGDLVEFVRAEPAGPAVKSLRVLERGANSLHRSYAKA